MSASVDRPARCHSVPVLGNGLTVQIALESAFRLDRNRCSDCLGISVQIGSESVFTFRWNQCSFSHGICRPLASRHYPDLPRVRYTPCYTNSTLCTPAACSKRGMSHW